MKAHLHTYTLFIFHTTVEMKMNISPEELGANMPVAFPEYLRTVRSLHFTERPNYGRLMNMFYLELIRMGIKPEEQKVDWDIGHNRISTVYNV